MQKNGSATIMYRMDVDAALIRIHRGDRQGIKSDIGHCERQKGATSIPRYDAEDGHEQDRHLPEHAPSWSEQQAEQALGIRDAEESGDLSWLQERLVRQRRSGSEVAPEQEFLVHPEDDDWRRTADCEFPQAF